MAITAQITSITHLGNQVYRILFASGNVYDLGPISAPRELIADMFTEQAFWEQALISIVAVNSSNLTQAQAFVGRVLTVNPAAAQNIVRLV